LFIFLDEVWFHPKGTRSIWVPHSLLERVVTLMFSSPTDKFPFHRFGQLMLNERCQKGLKVLNFSKICSTCKLKDPTLIKCKHADIKGSDRKSDNTDFAQFALGGDFDTELLGIVKDSQFAAFTSDAIFGLFTKKRIKLKDDFKYFVFSVDSNYGGKDTTAFSGGYQTDDGKDVICWGTYYQTKNIEELNKLFFKNLAEFRNTFGDKPIVVVYESQARWCGSQMEAATREMAKKDRRFTDIMFLVDAYRIKRNEERSREVAGIIATKKKI